MNRPARPEQADVQTDVGRIKMCICYYTLLYVEQRTQTNVNRQRERPRNLDITVFWF